VNSASSASGGKRRAEEEPRPTHARKTPVEEKAQAREANARGEEGRVREK
jgi:hypothetical protein